MKKLVIAVSALTLFGATAVMAKEAADIYKSTCATCHGPKGEGKKALGPPQKGNEFIIKGTDADVAAVIKNGRAGAAKKYKEFASPMPAQKTLTDAEIVDLVKFLKGDIQK